LIRFATIRPRTEFEIKRWFARKKVSEKDSKIALDELKKAGLIDDEAFAKWWVDQRVTFRPKSQRMLVMELIKHGVDKELAQEVVAGSEISDEVLAKELVRKKKRSWERLAPEERKKKTITFLQMRGFRWGVIKGIVDNDL
ncbi:regulatory protein RecX, partial [Candidatus Microgenomates bacterium]|nr:regulatory protein RecX [Candidatus Microgenomates bacterium]